MKNKITSVLLCMLLIISVFSVTVSADTGPKPSVNVEIKGVAGEYYVTLLSEYEHYGPYAAYDGTEESKRVYDDGQEHIWEKFVSYKDPDGFYFLQHFGKCEGEDIFKWGYYPPDVFKILVYVPETDTFISGGICESYAFDSYFLFDVSEGKATVTKNYDYTLEILSLLARVVITIAVEIGIAFVFAYFSKKELLFIACVNTATQLILNIMLNVINFYSGDRAFTAYYFILEFAVFAIEAVLYSGILTRLGKERTKPAIAVIYAAVANFVSLFFGLLIANLIPGIF